MPNGLVDDPKVYVSIATDGTVTVICNRSEMGQGEFMGAFPSALSPGVACPGDPRCTDFFGYRDPDGDPFKGDWSGDQFYDIAQWGATLRAEWDLGFATLTSVP
eukprot:gene2217-2887_t